MVKKSTRAKRAYNPAEVIAKKYKEAKFTGAWLSLIGKPELSGTWIVWGGSGEGKTSFSLQLADYLTNFGKVAYNSLEQGISKSLRVSIVRNKLENSKILILDKESIDDLKYRLSRKSRTPNIIFIDSLQYTGMTYTDYKNLKAEFKNKLFIFISHAEGDLPRGSIAQSIRYDADVKIQVKGFKAFALTSRFLDGKSLPYTIWQDGANEYWVE